MSTDSTAATAPAAGDVTTVSTVVLNDQLLHQLHTNHQTSTPTTHSQQTLTTHSLHVLSQQTITSPPSHIAQAPAWFTSPPPPTTAAAASLTSPPPPTTSPSSPPISSTPHPHPPMVTPSRRVRVYHLQTDGSWSDWGVGWCWYGDEIPVQADDSSHRQHILIKQEMKPKEQQADGSGEHETAPVGALGLPSLTLPTIFSLHVPDATDFQTQGNTILTFTTRFSTHQHPGHNSASPSPLAPRDGDTIDVAFSFQTPSDLDDLWKYIHSFPEIVQQQIEEQERLAQEEEEEEQEAIQREKDKTNRQNHDDLESMEIDTSDPQQPRQQQHSPRTSSLYSEEQMDDVPTTHISTLRQYQHSWPSSNEDEEDEMDELTEPTEAAATSITTTSPTDANRTAAKSSIFPPDSTGMDIISHYMNTDSSSGEGKSSGTGGPLVPIGRRNIRRNLPKKISDLDGEVESDEEQEEENSILPSSIKVPSLDNLPEIHRHITQLLSKQGLPKPQTKRRQWSMLNSIGIGPTPIKQRQAFVTKITAKSPAYKTNLLISSAKKPIAIRARSKSPAVSAATTPATESTTATSPAPTAATAPTPTGSSTFSTPPVSSSPPPAPVTSPDDLNWLENLSVLLRTIDEEVQWREEHNEIVRLSEPPLNASNEPVDTTQPLLDRVRLEMEREAVVLEREAAIPKQTAKEDGQTDQSTSVTPPTTTPSTVSQPPITPAQATLTYLLTRASQIQEIISLLFSFQSIPLLNYLFDCSSVHAIYYQWFLVLTAYEYENAINRRADFLSKLGGGAAAVNTASLWHRHRSYFKSVVFKSPFPLHLTHVIDINTFNQAVGSQEQNQIDQLAAPPTRFGLIVLASYYFQYVRDTILYSPRALDDPIQQSMNQQVLFRNLNAIMNGLIQDGDSSPAQSTGENSIFGLRRTQSNFRQIHQTNLTKKQSKRKSGEQMDSNAPTWPKFIFSRIEELIADEDKKYDTNNSMTITNQSKVSTDSTTASPSSHLNSASPPIPIQPLPGVYPHVIRLTRDWCPLLPLTFCESLADFVYGLHSLFALTKNANSQNGISAIQKEKFFAKLIDEGVVQCIERILQFCKRQQIRLETIQPPPTTSPINPLPLTTNGIPSFASSLLSRETISWLRVLCLDFLTSLQTAKPGYIRRYMQPHIHLIHTQDMEVKMKQEAEGKHAEANSKPIITEPTIINRKWQPAHEKCRTTRLHISQLVATADPKEIQLQDSLLMLCFQLMADKQCYAGIRQVASTLLRLCLDPEYGYPSQATGISRLYDSGGEMGGGGGLGNNPLVGLLALGGVGSSAAKQLQYDSEDDDDADEVNEIPNPKRAYLSVFGMDLNGRDRRRKPTESEQQKAAQRALEEAKRKKKEMLARRHAKQTAVAGDELLQFTYASSAQAMERIVDVLRAAAQTWCQLQANQPISSTQLAAYHQAHPTSLIIDCIDFLSFAALRHSLLFQDFAISVGIFDILVSFFPQPKLTPEELEKEATRVKSLESKSASAITMNEMKVDSDLSQPTPSPEPIRSPEPSTQKSISDVSNVTLVTPPATPSTVFLPPLVTAPAGILCAAMRFLRISMEIDPVFIQPIQLSNILFCLVELFLHNLRPNLLHSAILEIFAFIDEKRVKRLSGQLLQGNQYVQSALDHDRQKRAAKLQSQIDRLKKSQPQPIEPPIKAEDTNTPMVINAAPDVGELEARNELSQFTDDGEFGPVPPPAQPTIPVISTEPTPVLPYLSSAYGISRVGHLPIWPSHFDVLRTRRQRPRRSLSDAVTEVVGEGSPSVTKRRREEDIVESVETGSAEEEEEADATVRSQPKKKSKTSPSNSAAKAEYSGTELDSDSSDESDEVNSSSSGESSDSDKPLPNVIYPGRGIDLGDDFEDGSDSRFEDQDQDLQYDGDHFLDGRSRHRSEHLAFLDSQREHDRSTEDDYFSSFEEEPTIEQKTQQGGTPRGNTTTMVSETGTRYVLHREDDDDEDMFSDNASTTTASSATTAATSTPSVSDAFLAASTRLLELEAQMKARHSEEQSAGDWPMTNWTRPPIKQPATLTVGGLHAAPTNSKPLIAFNLGTKKLPNPVSTPGQPTTTPTSAPLPTAPLPVDAAPTAPQKQDESA